MAEAEPDKEALQKRVAALTEELDQEKRRTARLQSELKRLKELNVETQVRLEHEEEAITNQLMKRIDRLREEKEAVVAAVDREEEYISNTLQKQLSALMREKLQLEEKLQHEEAEHAEVLKRLTDTFNQRMSERNKLQSERCTIENQLEQEQERIINSMSSQVQALLTERGKLKRDNERLRGQLRSLGVSRSVSPAISRGYPSPASSPRNPPVMGTAGFGDPPLAPLSQH